MPICTVVERGAVAVRSGRLDGTLTEAQAQRGCRQQLESEFQVPGDFAIRDGRGLITAGSYVSFPIRKPHRQSSHD